MSQLQQRLRLRGRVMGRSCWKRRTSGNKIRRKGTQDERWGESGDIADGGCECKRPDAMEAVAVPSSYEHVAGPPTSSASVAQASLALAMSHCVTYASLRHHARFARLRPSTLSPLMWADIPDAVDANSGAIIPPPSGATFMDNSYQQPRYAPFYSPDPGH